MSTKLPPSVPSYGFGIVLQEDAPSSLVGRILEIIEALGLQDKQETSVKNLIKDVIYKSFNPENHVVLRPNLHDTIRAAKQRHLTNPDSTSEAVGLEDLK